jgi:hypothetical protein
LGENDERTSLSYIHTYIYIMEPGSSQTLRINFDLKNCFNRRITIEIEIKYKNKNEFHTDPTVKIIFKIKIDPRSWKLPDSIHN